MDGAPEVSEEDLPSPSGFTRFHPFIKGVFSQWHATPFDLEGRRFVTAEQWMMFAKARLFDDIARAEAILGAPDPGEQKRHGQQVAGFDQATWDRWKVDIVHRGSLAKFGQNDGALRQLLATGDAMLVEANPRDWIWGVGLSADDPAAQSPAAWKGSNLLGRILTDVKTRLAR
ncbi:NADAR family protein [Caulobacter mirabilis]|uniref:GTP cyclohydrolase n=1 Tax=Caulobacter mirabilis TaxID=69666 RepID=A0A2D2B438_9CAUL|nr:NADAR family protein [Caulobacter mirabilis]ATQ45031.1 GTP cyclohydrolase [Caulobacter mirabilis]